MSGRDEDGSSHNDYDVLYIGFTGKDAVPGAKGANWTAGSFDEFHSSIKNLGDKLVSKIGSGGSGSTPTATSAAAPSATVNCKWAGHCLGESSLLMNLFNDRKTDLPSASKEQPARLPMIAPTT